MKYLKGWCICLICFSIWGSEVTNIEDIREDVLNAYGGQQFIDTKSLSCKGTISVAGSPIKGKFYLDKKFPGQSLFRQFFPPDIENIMVLNGDIGSIKKPNTNWTELSDHEVRLLQNISVREWVIGELKGKLEGKQEFKGINYWVVRVQFEEIENLFYIEPNSFLVHYQFIQLTLNGHKSIREAHFSNFVKIRGVTFPKKISQFANKQKITLEFESFIINPTLDQKLFTISK